MLDVLIKFKKKKKAFAAYTHNTTEEEHFKQQWWNKLFLGETLKGRKILFRDFFFFSLSPLPLIIVNSENPLFFSLTLTLWWFSVFSLY